MIPLFDENNERSSFIITKLIVLLCFTAFFYELWLDTTVSVGTLDNFIRQTIFIPVYFLTDWDKLDFLHRLLSLLSVLSQISNNALFKIIASSFLHSSLFHIVGNMWMLWIVADNVEHVMGRVRFLLFYLTGCIVSEISEILLMTSHSMGFLNGALGASGGVMAVMGAYVNYFPHKRVNVYSPELRPFVFFDPRGRIVSLRAWIVFGLYFLLNCLQGYLAHKSGTDLSVAVWAHAAGFGYGYLLSFLCRDPSVALGGWQGIASHSSSRTVNDDEWGRGR